MIEFYRLTGKSDGDRIQVKARTGEEMYAPMINVGTSTSVPTQKWLLENKDNFIALVSYERDSFSRPLIIGFYPVKGAKSSDFDLMLKVMNLFDNLLEHLLQAKTKLVIVIIVHLGVCLGNIIPVVFYRPELIYNVHGIVILNILL